MAGTQWLPPCPPLPGPPFSAPLFRRLAASRPRDRPPSGDPVLALLTVEQVPLEKAREAAVIQQDGQEHACGRERVTRKLGLPGPETPRCRAPHHLWTGACRRGQVLPWPGSCQRLLPLGLTPRRSVGTRNRVRLLTTLLAPCSGHKCLSLGPSSRGRLPMLACCPWGGERGGGTRGPGIGGGVWPTPRPQVLPELPEWRTLDPQPANSRPPRAGGLLPELSRCVHTGSGPQPPPLAAPRGPDGTSVAIAAVGSQAGVVFPGFRSFPDLTVGLCLK